MDPITALLAELARALNSLLSNLFSVLPGSPFRGMIEFVDKYDILAGINYFIPFDIAVEMLTIWLSAVIGYYAYLFIKGTLNVKNTFLGPLFQFFL